ncbi:MAG: hypothetical protein ABI680_16470, partial [Chthoniobacteraceae bacterium]
MKRVHQRVVRVVWGPQPSRLSALASSPQPSIHQRVPRLVAGRCVRRNPRALPSRACRARAAAFLSLWLVFLALPVAADPLEAELRPLSTAVRAQGPSLIDVTLKPQSPRVLEGTFELRMEENERAVSILRRPDIALVGGSRTLRLLLPPSPAVSMPFEQTITARFASGQKEFEIGRMMQNVVRVRSGASLILAVARRPERMNAAVGRLWQNLCVERFVSDTQRPFYALALSTAPAFLAPADFPTEPLTYCAFDAVFFEPGAFSELKEKALAALGTWLAAGGSVCLAGREPFAPAHAAALQQWIAMDPAHPELHFDAEGNLEPLPRGLLRARIGLGRLVLVESELAPRQQEVSVEWRRAAAFLWKYRPKIAG